MNQIDLEMQTYQHGRAKAQFVINKNEAEGRASTNPYAQAIFRRYVQPLAAMIADAVQPTKGAGRRAAHIALLRPLDPEAVAFLSVRCVLTGLLESRNGDNGGARDISHEVGRTAYHEYALSMFEHAAPDLFHTLVNDFGRKMSKSERHRMTVFKMQAKANGVQWTEWAGADVEQVGAFLVECMEVLGMIETERYSVKKGKGVTTRIRIDLTQEVRTIISRITDRVIETSPYFLPCIEKPRDWVALDDGGFHTKEMRRLHPFAVRCKPAQRDHFREADLRTTLDALNALQAVRWRVNGRMLDTVRRVANHFDMDEVLSQADFPKPQRPVFLDVVEKDAMTEQQLKEFSAWKREVAEWHTQMKLRGTKWGRLVQALRVADQFREYEAIHFVYFSDFRDRKYAQTTGISPQGSDLQKALIQFADGEPLDSQEAIDWFLITGANKWGFDKAPLQERKQWVLDREDMILAFAEDPIANNEWREADAPLQFLAWAFEFSDWRKSPATFVSRYPVAMDGTCNGLQNFSAMLRDEVGGEATNLVPAAPGAPANDIYGMVASRTTDLLRHMEPDEQGFRDMWLSHGINRTLVKRSVMTLPYGSTRFSCADFIVSDYLKQGKAPEIPKHLYLKAASYLSHVVWKAISFVVVKARAAMDWLQESSKVILRGAGIDSISWVSPSGFPAIQTYWELDVQRIRTKLHGTARIRVVSETDEPDVNHHTNGIAPNFVHSMDAAHLTLTTLRAKREGIDALAMIHDDYGCHARFAGKLYKIIREVFVEIYTTHDPLADFAARYPGLPPLPEKGKLDLSLVLDSEFFFS